MPFVMLRKNWQGTFKRTLRRDTPSERMIAINPGEVVTILPTEVPDIEFDLGKALLPCEWSNEKQKYVIVDMDAIDTQKTAIEPAQNTDTSGDNRDISDSAFQPDSGTDLQKTDISSLEDHSEPAHQYDPSAESHGKPKGNHKSKNKDASHAS